MVFFTSINILDTGFLSKATRTTQLGSGSRVNSGTTMAFKGITLQFISSANIDKTGSPAKFTASQYPLISINPTTFQMVVYVGMKYINTSNPYGINDVALLPLLLQLPWTAGWKAIYMPIDIASAASYLLKESQVIYAIGGSDTAEGQGDISFSAIKDGTVNTGKNLTNVKYLCARFESCTLSYDPSAPFATRVTLTGVLTV